MHNLLIPAWFYGLDSAMYFISAMVGFILSFYFHRIFSISAKKKHLYLHLGFAILSMAFLILSISNLSSYTAYMKCESDCHLGMLDEIFSFEDFSHFLYFGLSFVAYMFFVVAYTDEYENFSKRFVPLFIIYIALLFAIIPLSGSKVLWYSYNEYFHLTAFLLLIFLSFKNLVNYEEKKATNALIVTVGFGSIALFHLLHLFVFLNEWIYVFAHVFILIGFVSLLTMIMRVKRK
jgi:hypothetical protein